MRSAFAVCGRNPREYMIQAVNAADELVFEFRFSVAFDDQGDHLTRRALQ